jgi:two-component system sensor histidine kinase KdpD
MGSVVIECRKAGGITKGSQEMKGKHTITQKKNPYHPQVAEHVLICLSTAPSNEKIIRIGAHIARTSGAALTALFVETPDFSAATAENKQRLQDNRKLARGLGARIETVYGENVPYQIAEYARVSGVTKIVLGRSYITRKHPFGKPTLTEQLLDYAPEIDVRIIPDQSTELAYRIRKTGRDYSIGIIENSVKSILILLAATALSMLFFRLGFTDANIIMVYLLGVLLTSITTSRRGYSLVSSVASVFIFNYLFTTPRFSLTAYGTGYPVTFVVMFLTAFITGTFANRYKEQARLSDMIAHRTKILFDTDRLLSKAGDKEEILTATANQIIKLLGRNIIIYGTENGELSNPPLFHSNKNMEEPYDMELELTAATWALKNNHRAGATTETLSDARYLYLTLRMRDRVYGVIGIEAEQSPLDLSEQEILLSILGECALALENEKNAREKEAAAILARSEQLRANLLRAISHDLRTPLTSISGNASNLLNNGAAFSEETRIRLYEDIYEDSMWLISLVENLLSATRIEEGRMTLRTSPELLDDIVEEAMRHIKSKEHQIHVVSREELLLVRADAKLVVQVIVNIVDNAVKYTPPGSEVVITTEKDGNMAKISIADNGSGIAAEEKEKIFEKFYCGEHKIADNRRSLGLGLYLCKSIVEAHGGTISVSDNEPQGTIFCFTLPQEEVTLNE